MKITEKELDEILSRCHAASPGPWKSYIEGRDHESGSNFIMTGADGDRGPDIELSGATEADQDFIANSKQDIPRLVAILKDLIK